MAGLISNEEAEKKINKTASFLNTIIHGSLKQKPTKRLKYAERVEIAAEAVVSSAKETAEKYGLVPQYVQRLAEGKFNGANDNKNQTEVRAQFVTDVKDRLAESRASATDLLAASLGLITPEQLADLNTKDKIEAAGKFAKMIEVMTPTGSIKAPPVIIIAAPEIRTLNSIEDVIEIGR